MYKYKGNNPSELLNIDNYPISYGEGDLEVVFDKISEDDIEWANSRLSGKETLEDLSKEIIGYCQHNSPWRALLLLECERKVFLKNKKPFPGYDGNKAMLYSCKAENTDCVKILLSKNTSPYRSGYDSSPLDTIIKDTNNFNLAKLLIDHDSNQEYNFHEILTLAKDKKRYEISEYLAKKLGVDNPLDAGHKLVLALEKEAKIAKKESEESGQEGKPKTDSRWLKLDDYSILFESKFKSADRQTKIETNTVFNFYSARINTKIHRRDISDMPRLVMSDDLNFSELDAKHELEIAKSKFVEQGGILPAGKPNKSDVTVLANIPQKAKV